MIDVLGEVRRATAAAERGSWTAAVDGFRRAIRGSGEPVPEALKQNLAACLANRAAAAVERAGKAPQPDEAEQRQLAATRAVQYLLSPSAPSAPRAAPGPAPKRRWRQSVRELTWTGALFWLVFSSPLWGGGLALLLGMTQKEVESLFGGLFVVLWVFVMIVSVVTWIGEHWPRSLTIDPFAYGAQPREPLPPCAATGCTSQAAFTVDLNQIAGFPGGRGPGATHLCAVHARGLEEAMSRPVPNPRAVSALLKARKDLEEAAQLDPGARTIREGLKQVDEILDSVGQPRREGRAAPDRRSTRGRRARAPAKGR